MANLILAVHMLPLEGEIWVLQIIVYMRGMKMARYLLGTNLAGSYHRYKINWNANTFVIYVDGVLINNDFQNCSGTHVSSDQ